MIKDQRVQTHCCPSLPFSQLVLGSATCCCGQPVVVWSLFLQQSHQVMKAEQFRGVFSCARTVTAPCSLCLHLTALLPLFLHLLWSSLTPSRTPSRVKNQSTIFRRFHELGGPGEPGRCRSGGLDGNGKATREGAVSALGQPGWWVPWAVPPKNPLHS